MQFLIMFSFDGGLAPVRVIAITTKMMSVVSINQSNEFIISPKKKSYPPPFFLNYYHSISMPSKRRAL